MVQCVHLGSQGRGVAARCQYLHPGEHHVHTAKSPGHLHVKQNDIFIFFPEQLLQGPSWLDEWSLSRMGAPGDDILAALGALPVFFSCQYRSWWFWVLYTQGTCKPSAPMNQ